MISKHICTRGTILALTGLAIVLVGPACSETPSRPMPITTGDGGWEHVYNLPQGDGQTRDLFFLDNKTGWVLSGGLVLKTTNGGVTWSPQNPGETGKAMSAIWFTDSNNGWIIGFHHDLAKAGLMLRTTDGGATWKEQSPPENLNLYTLYFVDSKTGWAIGTEGPGMRQPFSTECKVVKTTDGGDTWSVISTLPVKGQMLAAKIFFVDAQHGWICGGRGGRLMGAPFAGNIIRTVDGGKTWVNPGMPKHTPLLDDICFIDRSNGWACGHQNTILRTTNSGDTWETRKITPEGFDDCSFDSIYFVDSKNGWACGGSGVIVRTTDGGATWSLCKTDNQTALKTAKLTAIRFDDPLKGWAAGWDGVILRTTDGGKTWISPQPRIMRGIWAVEFVDAKTGWITGYDGVRNGQWCGGAICKTTDGGLTWVQQRSNGDECVSSLCFIDGQNGWALASNGGLVATEDGGATWLRRKPWTEASPGSKISASRMRRFDSDHAWILAGDYTDQRNAEYSIRRTTDGGKTWESLSTGTVSPIRDIWFADRKTGWEVGLKGTLLKTIDGGNTWKRIFTGTTKNLASVQFVDSKIGWIAGQEGLMMKSTDGGETWTRKELGTQDDLTKLQFVGADTGWVGTSKGIVLMTTDGGRTWTQQRTGADSYVSFVDSDHGWMGGGGVVRTATSGLPGCVWAKQQPDGKATNFGHLVVTETTEDSIYAVHPDSKIGMRIRIKDPKANVGDYVYVHGKIASDGAERVIDADSVDVITAGWGIVDRESKVAAKD